MTDGVALAADDLTLERVLEKEVDGAALLKQYTELLDQVVNRADADAMRQLVYVMGIYLMNDLPQDRGVVGAMVTLSERAYDLVKPICDMQPQIEMLDASKKATAAAETGPAPNWQWLLVGYVGAVRLPFCAPAHAVVLHSTCPRLVPYVIVAAHYQYPQYAQLFSLAAAYMNCFSWKWLVACAASFLLLEMFDSPVVWCATGLSALFVCARLA